MPEQTQELTWFECKQCNFAGTKEQALSHTQETGHDIFKVGVTP